MKGYCPVKMFLFLLCFLMTISFAQNKISTAVLDLDASGISQAEALIISDRLRSELVQLGRFDVFEREKMNQILSEQGFQMSGCTSNECVIEAGKLIGVRLMIVGSIGKIGDLYTVNTRIIDIQTGRVIRTAVDDCDCKIEEVLTKAMKRVAEKLTGERAAEKKREVRKETKPRIVKPKKLYISPIVGYGFNDIDETLTFGVEIGLNVMKGRMGIRYLIMSPEDRHYAWGSREPIHDIFLTYEYFYYAYKKLIITPRIGAGIILGKYYYEEKYYDYIWDDWYYYSEWYVHSETAVAGAFGLGFGFNISPSIYLNVGYDYYLSFGEPNVSNNAIIMKIGFNL
jgi:hypothetical protein